MYMYVNKRVELAGRVVALQKMYALLFYYYQFRHLTLEDIQLFILLLALNKEKKISWTQLQKHWAGVRGRSTVSTPNMTHSGLRG